MLTASECLLYPCVPDAYSMIYPDEYDSLPVLMRLYAETFTLAARLGFLAVQLRKEKQSLSFADFDLRKDEISDLRREFSRPWESPDVSYWYQQPDSLPRRSREMLQQVSVFGVSFYALNTELITVSYPIPCLPAVLLQQHVARPTSRIRTQRRNQSSCRADPPNCRADNTHSASRPAIPGLPSVPCWGHHISQRPQDDGHGIDD